MRYPLILVLALGLAGCQTTLPADTGCRGHITAEMLKEPLPTPVLPEERTPQREMFEAYLRDLEAKGLNDADHLALIAALKRCWNDK